MSRSLPPRAPLGSATNLAEVSESDPASHAVAGETPILDRNVPFPPRVARGSGLTAVLTVWFGAAIILAACWSLDRPPILRQWCLTEFRPWLLDQRDRIGLVGCAFSLVAAFYLMLAVHELGHVVAGLCVGFRCRSLRVGPLLFNSPVRVSLYRGPGAVVQGVAEMIPLATDNLAPRGVAMVLGGPLANILSATVLPLWPAPATLFSTFFIVCSIVNAVNDLLPFESRLGVSDGRRIWMLLTQPARGERWLALLHLGGQLSDGVLPESLSPGFLAKAIAVRDASADTVQAYAIAYSAAFQLLNDDEAAERLETCLAYAGYAAPAVREALASDAAVFQARRRKRADLAEQWLNNVPKTTQASWLRSRAEAAILESQGDFPGAVAKLSEVEFAILRLPDATRRNALVRLLQRWKAELLRVSSRQGESAGAQ
jgi:hypothetical protein